MKAEPDRCWEGNGAEAGWYGSKSGRGADMEIGTAWKQATFGRKDNLAKRLMLAKKTRR